MRKKNLLIDEYPLLVLPSLAKAIGLNEAIALQQLHYWLENPKGGVMMDGERWVYNTYEDWQKDNFPFWSVHTVQRVFMSLEKIGFVISMQKAEYDRKKYYRVHYANLASWNETDCHNAELQDGTMEEAKVASSLTETTTETNTDTTKKKDLLDGILHLQLKPKGIQDAIRNHFKLTPNWGMKTNRQFLEWAVSENVTPEQIKLAAQVWGSDKRFNWAHPHLKGIQEHWLQLIESSNHPDDDNFMEELAARRARLLAEKQAA